MDDPRVVAGLMFGKMRHLAVAQLWAQERVRSGDFRRFKVAGTDNPADILTKPVVAELLRVHLSARGMFPEQGRAETAPGTKRYLDTRSTSPLAVVGESANAGASAPRVDFSPNGDGEVG